MANKNKSVNLQSGTESNDELTTRKIRDLLREAVENDIKEVEKIITDLESNYEVGIGVRLDMQKICEILTFMITNNKPFITLKFEVWHTPQQAVNE